MSEIYALGVFRIPLSDVKKFERAWQEFVKNFGDFDGHVFIAKADENRETQLINSVVEILNKIEELGVAVEAEAQFVEAFLEEADSND